MLAEDMTMTRSSSSTTAFVLAGGGSLGAVEVGMLQALVEAGVTPDLVVGASVGAINGVHFAAAPNASGIAALADIWRQIGQGDIFPVSVIRSIRALLGSGTSLVSPEGLRRLLENHLPCDALENTAIPVHVVASDFISGEEVVLSRGPAVEAILASSAIPAIFPPVRHGDTYLVDGGVANNTPVTVAVRLGARRVIVLPTGFSCHGDPSTKNAIGVALHTLNLLISRQLVSDLERLQRDVELVVIPPLCPMNRPAHDFSGTEALIEFAAKSTRSWLEEGGLEDDGIPGALRPHAHRKDPAP